MSYGLETLGLFDLMVPKKIWITISTCPIEFQNARSLPASTQSSIVVVDLVQITSRYIDSREASAALSLSEQLDTYV